MDAGAIAYGPRRFNLEVQCRCCGQSGFVIWEETGDHDRVQRPGRQLIHVSRGFHPELGTLSGDPLIVCNACDSLQKD